jgi:hypothetical protein
MLLNEAEAFVGKSIKIIMVKMCLLDILVNVGYILLSLGVLILKELKNYI